MNNIWHSERLKGSFKTPKIEYLPTSLENDGTNYAINGDKQQKLAWAKKTAIMMKRTDGSQKYISPE